jgi:hypothetical protein
VQVLNFNGDDLVTAPRILVDVANTTRGFDNVAGTQIVLVGSNIDVNRDGYSILFSS